MTRYLSRIAMLWAVLYLGLPVSALSQNIPHANVASYENGKASDIATEQLNFHPATGTLDVGFTLFDYSNSSRALRHAVSISYDARGVKVDEVASSLGQNWSLNLEGSIRRQVYGLPDEVAQYGFSAQSAVPALGPLYTQYMTQYMLKAVEDSLDTQYDVFDFDAGGQSGKFIIGKDGSIALIPQSNIKIERLGATGACSAAPLFKITLENGMQYWFDRTDCVQLKYSLERERTAATTWYLTKIVAPFNVDTIHFNYEEYSYQYVNPPKYIKYKVLAPNPNVGHPFCDEDAAYSVYSETNITCSRPKDVLYPDGSRVSFVYDTRSRIDLPADRALREVNVIQGVHTYGYRFQHSFMDRRSAGGISVSNWNYENTCNDQGLNVQYRDSSYCFSLQLDGFYKFSGADTVPGYRFNYYRMVPPRRGYRFGVDLWGYFCGNAVDRYSLEERKGNLYYAKAKALESITLPMGGKIRFEYELHSAQATNLSTYFNTQETISGLRLKKCYRSDGMGQNAIASTEYRYVLENNFNSGVMVNFPAHHFSYVESPYYYMNNPYAYALVSDCGGYQYLNYPMDNNFDATSCYPLNDLVIFQGSPVVYSRVEEYNGDVNNYLTKKVYTFSTNEEYSVPGGLLDNAFPFPQIPSLGFAWGLPLEVKTYTAGNLLKESTVKEYNVTISELDNANFRAVKVGLNHHDVPVQGSYFNHKHYYPVTGRALMVKERTTQYYENGLQFRDTVFYTFNARSYPKTVQYRNAAGSLMETRLFYPDDYSISGAVAALNTAGLLSRPLATESWNLSQNKLVDANAGTLDLLPNGNVKPLAQYFLSSTDPVPAASWGTFNPGQILQQPGYLNTETQRSRYDNRGNVLEYQNQGTTFSTIWGNLQHDAVAQVANAGYDDIAYTGFENALDWGNWNFLGGAFQLTTAEKYTGNNAILLSSATTGIQKAGLSPAKSYYLTVWTKSGAPQISITTPGGTATLTPEGSDEHLGWKLYRVKFSNAQSVKISSSANLYIDDLRLYPVGAAMKTFTYNLLYGITSVTDASNRTSYTEYDALGRKLLEKDMDGNIIHYYEHKYRIGQF